MKRPRAPYARRSAWIAIAILSAVLVVVIGVAGYEIHHLQSEVSGLTTTVNGLKTGFTQLYQAFLKLAGQVGK